MKATLHFDLEEIEDRNSHKRCINATNAYIMLYEFSNHLRSEAKYGDLDPLISDYLDKISETFYSMMDDHGVDLNDLE